MVAMSHEFDNIKVRDDELDELDFHKSHNWWVYHEPFDPAVRILGFSAHYCSSSVIPPFPSMIYPIAGGSENTHGKVNILMQAYISRASINVFSLVSDAAYVAQNGARILRGLFEIALRKNWPATSNKLLTLSKCLDKRLWPCSTPLRQVGVA